MNHSDDLRHLSECQTCRLRFSENVLPFDSARRSEGARAFAAAAAQLERERENAANLVERQLRQTPTDEGPSLVESPPRRSNAALEQLSEVVRKRLERTPVEELASANLSTA